MSEREGGYPFAARQDGASGNTGEEVSVDFISLPETTSRSSEVTVDEILTVTDRATKMVDTV